MLYMLYMLYAIYRQTIYPSSAELSFGGEIMEKSSYQHSDSEADGEDDTSIYARSVRESMLEDDELSPMEEAFMNGYGDF